LIDPKAETESIVQKVREKYKEQVIKATKIELQVMKNQITTDLASSTCLATKDFLIADGIPITHVDTTVNTILDRYHDKLLKHSFATIEEFREANKIDAAITVNPEPITTTTSAIAATGGNSTTAMRTPHFRCAVQQPPQHPAQPARMELEDKIHKAVPRIFRALKKIFIVPWNVHLDTIEKH
jgi:phosphomevalonate kinase